MGEYSVIHGWLSVFADQVPKIEALFQQATGRVLNAHPGRERPFTPESDAEFYASGWRLHGCNMTYLSYHGEIRVAFLPEFERWVRNLAEALNDPTMVGPNSVDGLFFLTREVQPIDDERYVWVIRDGKVERHETPEPWMFGYS